MMVHHAHYKKERLFVLKLIFFVSQVYTQEKLALKQIIALSYNEHGEPSLLW
jgi:hypothetical protein